MSTLLQEQLDAAASNLARQMDAELRSVLDAFRPGWSFDQVREHCRFVTVAGSPIETFCWDSTPLLELHPIQTSMERKDGSWIYKATRNVRRFTYQL